MPVVIRPYTDADLAGMTEIWNEVVLEGNAFPQTDPLGGDEARDFFASQTQSAVAADESGLLGLYVLHPNNVGRCGHIANASFAVKRSARGRGVGEPMVRECLRQAALHGFRIMQFNAVVSTNLTAIRIYEKIGFRRIGTVPGGFLLPDGSYEDIVLFYIEL